MKEMHVTWDINKSANFKPIFFLQGDYGIGVIDIHLINIPSDFEGNIRAIFCSSSDPKKPYVLEREIKGSDIQMPIPNEILQKFGKVYCRLVLRESNRNRIVGSIQEIYFHVVERSDWEFLEPLLPDSEDKYVQDVIDELYEIVKTSKQDLRDYVEELKKEFSVSYLTVEEAREIINKYKNKE